MMMKHGVIPGQAALAHLDGWTVEEMAIEPAAAMIIDWPGVVTRRFDFSTFSMKETPYNEAKEKAEEKEEKKENEVEESEAEVLTCWMCHRGSAEVETFSPDEEDDYNVASDRVPGRYGIATYIAEQMLIDGEEYNDWYAEFYVDLDRSRAAGEPFITLRDIAPLGLVGATGNLVADADQLPHH